MKFYPLRIFYVGSLQEFKTHIDEALARRLLTLEEHEPLPTTTQRHPNDTPTTPQRHPNDTPTIPQRFPNDPQTIP
jgi:hypothetical protein